MRRVKRCSLEELGFCMPRNVRIISIFSSVCIIAISSEGFKLLVVFFKKISQGRELPLDPSRQMVNFIVLQKMSLRVQIILYKKYFGTLSLSGFVLTKKVEIFLRKIFLLQQKDSKTSRRIEAGSAEEQKWIWRSRQFQKQFFAEFAPSGFRCGEKFQVLFRILFPNRRVIGWTLELKR